MVRAFQGATQALRYADVPVVVAPAGLTLGGGCEIALHARSRAGGGRKLHRPGRSRRRPDSGRRRHEGDARARGRRPARRATDLLPFVQRVFETIGFAKVSTSAADARRLGYLRRDRRVTMNRERLMADAKALALERVREGYRPPAPRTAIPVGGDGVLAALKLGVHLAWRAGRISDHDALIGRTLARDPRRRRAAASDDRVSEQYLLDLEREAFLQAVRRAEDARAHPAHAEDGQAAAGTEPWQIHRSNAAAGAAARPHPRHSGSLGVDAPGGRRARRHRSASSRSRCAASAAADAPFDPRAGSTTTSTRSTRCSTTPASSARRSAASRSAGSSRSASPRVIPTAIARARAGVDARPGLAPATRAIGSTRGCRGCFGPLFLAGVAVPRCAPSSRPRFRTRRPPARSRAASSRTLASRARLARAGWRARARLIAQSDARRPTARAIAAPTLVVTGEPRARSRRAGRRHVGYAAADSPARSRVVLERTGHLGPITRPDAFAAIVRDFVATRRRAQAVA